MKEFRNGWIVDDRILFSETVLRVSGFDHGGIIRIEDFKEKGRKGFPLQMLIANHPASLA